MGRVFEPRDTPTLEDAVAELEYQRACEPDELARYAFEKALSILRRVNPAEAAARYTVGPETWRVVTWLLSRPEPLGSQYEGLRGAQCEREYLKQRIREALAADGVNLQAATPPEGE